MSVGVDVGGGVLVGERGVGVAVRVGMGVSVGVLVGTGVHVAVGISVGVIVGIIAVGMGVKVTTSFKRDVVSVCVVSASSCGVVQAENISNRWKDRIRRIMSLHQEL